MKSPTYSVIIPTKDNLVGLAACLHAVVTTSPADTEILVVVNTEDPRVPAQVQACLDAMTATAKVQPRLVQTSTIGFSSAANCGLRSATGKFLVVLHDDAQPTKGWLENLQVALRLANKLSVGDVQFGFVGPVSNAAMGRQDITAQLKNESITDVQNREGVAMLLRQAEVPDFLPTATLDSFCLGMTRAAYEATQGFDERFNPAGYEDRDLLCRGQTAGILAVIAPRVFVHHVGRVTLQKDIPQPYGDLPNEELFFTTHYRDIASSQKTLCIGLIADVQTAHDLLLLQEQVQQAVALADRVVLLDRKSTCNVVQSLKDCGLFSKLAEYHRLHPHEQISPARERNLLLLMARKTQPDWICFLEPRQLFAKKVTRAVLQRLMHPVDPTAKAYRYAVRTWWGSQRYFRVDQGWAGRIDQQFFKNEAWGDYAEPAENEDAEGVLTVPSGMPSDNIVFTQQLVCHDHTFLDIERARSRGLTFSETPHLLLPASSPTLTHLLMVKNEEHEILRQIAQYREWADDFVVIDTGSTDRTRNICEQFEIPVIPFRCCAQSEDPTHLLCDYGAARNYAIEHCQTTYILFLDADEALRPKEYQRIPTLLLEGADGYICTLNNYTPTSGKAPGVYPTIQARVFKNRPEIRYAPAIHETLEEAFKNPALLLIKTDIEIDHLGYLRQSPADRAAKALRYATLLQECLEKDPTDARSLFALGQHYIANGDVDAGDVLLARALAFDENFFSARAELALRFMRRAYDLWVHCPIRSVPSEERKEMVRRAIKTLSVWVTE